MRTKLRGKVSFLFVAFAVMLAIPAVALAADLLTEAELSSDINARTQVEPNETTSFNIKVWARGNLPSSPTATGNANVINAYTLGSGGTISADTSKTTTLKFNLGHNYGGEGLICPTSVATQPSGVTGKGCASDPFIVPAKLTVGNIAAGTDGTLTVSVTGSNGLGLTTPQTCSTSSTVNDPNSSPDATDCSKDQGFVTVAVSNNAPTVSTAAANASGDEGDTLQTSGSFSDPDGDSLTITKLSGAGTVTPGSNGSWSWSLPTNDNGSGTVVVQASDGSLTVTDSFDWSAANVPPTITNISASAQNALTGKNVTFTGTVTDPSSADTQAGFFWQWSKDGGAYTPTSSLPNPFAAGGNPFTTSFTSCGEHTVSAKAADKDDGVSAPKALFDPISVYNASFSPPVDVAPYLNTVQKGRVIPVKISVSCNGNITGLTPSIQLLSGDKTDGSETTQDEIETYSVSSADTTGVMRAVDGGYIYNLQVPSQANAYYTVRVNPFGGSNASSNMYALLKTR